MSRAAEITNMVASAVSKRLAQLEQTVGTTLLIRRRHGVTPSAAGETLLEHARSILLSTSRIERDMLHHATGIHGRVNILATASVMAESLVEDIANFLHQAQYRDIQIDIEERISPEVIRGIREGVASIGICWDAQETSGLQAHTYCHDHLCVVVPRGHPLSHRESVSFEETLEFEHVVMPINSAVVVMMQRQATSLGKRLRHRIIVTNFEAALRVVRAGLSIALVPREVTNLYAQAYDLRVIELNENWAKRRFIVCHRGEDTLSSAAFELLSALTLKKN
jgi:DNA-binding transcriptional LysR family regulator